MGIKAALRKIHERTTSSGFHFGQPLVLLQSDDWGRVGVRDREGLEELRACGLKLGERPYDLYSLETAEDVDSVAETLESLKDSAGQPACLEMNFITANVDFEASVARNLDEITLKPLVEGLPGNWMRSGLFDAYRAGIQKRLFAPALHGATHFCQQPVRAALAANDERVELVRTLWRAGTPYIFWRMPWIGFEYWDPNRKARDRFLSAGEQQRWISFAAQCFEKFFGLRAASACAPGYRANEATARCWKSEGVRIAQNGPGTMRAPHFDQFGLLHSYRAADFEPALNPHLRCEDYVARARKWFAAGLPFIISLHSINFHSTLAPFRQRTLPMLSEMLRMLKRSFADLLYVNTQQLLDVVESGGYQGGSGRIQVSVHGRGSKA